MNLLIESCPRSVKRDRNNSSMWRGGWRPNIVAAIRHLRFNLASALPINIQKTQSMPWRRGLLNALFFRRRVIMCKDPSTTQKKRILFWSTLEISLGWQNDNEITILIYPVLGGTRVCEKLILAHGIIMPSLFHCAFAVKLCIKNSIFLHQRGRAKNKLNYLRYGAIIILVSI